LRPILKAIEDRLAQYIAVPAASSTRLFVSQLTRDHLRKTVSFFVSVAEGQAPVPFQEVGTGTLNILVLALLSFIAELKQNVIFAMEEPETALPPHTQRRIADYLLAESSQAFVTSHSPYVIERFEPAQVLLLSRTNDGALEGKSLESMASLPSNFYKRFARRGLAEAMLGRGVIVVEGVADLFVLQSAARRMEADNPELFPLDLAGVTLFSPDSGDGVMPLFGNYFKAIGLKTFAFYDRKARTPEDEAKFGAAFDINEEHRFSGIEALLADEVPVKHQWAFLSDLRDSGEHGNLPVPKVVPAEAAVRALTRQAMAGKKGAGWAARLIEVCPGPELPATVTTFLARVYLCFPRAVKEKARDDSATSNASADTGTPL